MLIAFDPGDTTGICIFNDDHAVQQMLQLSLDELIDWTIEYEGPVKAIVYEKFIVFRQKAHTQVGSKMKVSQAVGAIKVMARRKKAVLIEQQPDIKPVALKWSGITLPTVHSQTHQYDAFLHGYYFLRKNGFIHE